MMMDLEEIRQILDLIREHELAEFELERAGMKIRVRKEPAALRTGGPAGETPAERTIALEAAEIAMAAANGGSAALDPDTLAGEAEAVELAVVKSPIVGTFYRASEPGAKPFTEVGEFVKKGQVLCIIEAMKLMNEINAEVDGEVVKVYVENSQAVQYGERLFAIRPT